MELNLSICDEKINIYKNLDLSQYTATKTGGIASIVCMPKNRAELSTILQESYKQGVNCAIVGSLTNTLVSDKQIDKLLIMTSLMKGIIIKGDILIAAAGERLDHVLDAALEHHLTGLEELGGLPGTIGGAVYSNSGRNGKSISDHIFYVDVANKKGKLRRVINYQGAYSYRKSPFTPDDYITAVALRLNPTKNTADKKQMKEKYKRDAVNKGHFEYPSLGCFFKNPPNMSAGKLIDSLNLCGMKYNGAMVSKSHGCFIVNYDNATSSDLYELSKIVLDRVKDETGIELEYEIKFLGEF